MADFGVDDVLKWIAVKNVRLVEKLVIPDTLETRMECFGELQVLEELRKHIMMKTNPHNREDIKKLNDKESG